MRRSASHAASAVRDASPTRDVDVVQVGRHGADRDEQAFRDLGVHQAAGHQFSDLALAGRQR